MKSLLLLSALLLSLAGCQHAEAPASSSGAEQPLAGPTPQPNPPPFDEAYYLCSYQQADATLAACLPDWSPKQQAALKNTWKGWSLLDEKFIAQQLDRPTFRKRYSLDDQQVACFKKQFCHYEGPQ